VVEALKVIEREEAEPRLPPRNDEAEIGLLGAILINNRAYERVSEFLRPEHFSDPLNGRIFAACARLIERGQHADPTTLRHLFENDKDLAEVGGPRYLADLAAGAVTVINAEHYGRLIHDLHLRRELIGLGSEIVNTAFVADPELDARSQIESAEQQLYDLATTGEYEGGFKPFSNAITGAINLAQSAFKRAGKVAGVSSGFTKMDMLLGGLHKSDLIILAGRPSMGKTALATNIAFKVAQSIEIEASGDREQERSCVVGFFSLEMSAEQLANRILAEHAHIASDRIRKGELNDAEFEKLVIASQDLERAKLFIDDSPALTVSALRTRARRLKRQNGLDLIVVDYLQLLQGSHASRNDSRVQEISEITRGLKTLAKELDVPVLALSQLSRAVEQREDKRPQLADLRESGTIEQDADVVLFIFREEYYLERTEPTRRAEESSDKFRVRHEQWEENKAAVEGKAEVIVAKQRHGPTGKVELRFHAQATKFDNLEEDGGNDGYGGAPMPDGDVPF
jgi:replicative DNA helicase